MLNPIAVRILEGDNVCMAEILLSVAESTMGNVRTFYPDAIDLIDHAATLTSEATEVCTCGQH